MGETNVPKNQICLPVNRLPLISNCDYGQTEEGFVHPDRIMDVNVLLYIEKGGFRLREEDREYHLSEGNLFFLKQGLHHFGIGKCPPDTRWYFVHFYLPDNTSGRAFLPFEDFRYREGAGREDFAFYYPLPKLLTLSGRHPIILKLKELKDLFQNRNPQKRIYMNALFYELLLDIYSEGEARKPAALQEERSRELFRLLEHHSHEPFSSSVIEAEMGLSYKHLNEIFKKTTGTTLQQYHSRLRMEAAARLLRETGLSIAAVSEALGFEEPFYFSNVFKKQFGVSPLGYRKQNIRI